MSVTFRYNLFCVLCKPHIPNCLGTLGYPFWFLARLIRGAACSCFRVKDRRDVEIHLRFSTVHAEGEKCLK